MKKIAYSGIEGAFAHVAARRLFPDAIHVSYKSFSDAYEAVEKGECDAAVLPVENSYAGRVAEVDSLLQKGPLFINAQYELPIVQNLLGVRGSSIRDIKKVVSQKKALEQCDEYIRERGLKTEETVNTAVAAKQVSDLQMLSVAAIASLEVAALYGLRVLDEHINTKDDNKTRFVAVSKTKGAIDD